MNVHHREGINVGHALSNFKAFYCSTPDAIERKIKHLPSGKTAVVGIDVLRATSTLNAVAAAGASGIHVAPKPTDGSAAFTPPSDSFGPWAGGGEEHGRPIAGGCIANSPVEVRPGMFSGVYVKFVSTNGADAIAKVEKAGCELQYLASLANIEATIAAVIADGADHVLFVAGGFYGSASLEDNVCVGRGVKELVRRGFASPRTLDDEALLASLAANDFADDQHLVRTLRNQQVGRLLTEIGRGSDIDAVVTGAGVDPLIYKRMATTVLRYVRIEGIGMFVPGTYSAEVVA